MLFSSWSFLVFFAVYLPLHLITPQRYRLLLIIAGSTVFYSYWNIAYVWVPYLLIAIAYYGAIFIESSVSPAQRKQRLIIVLIVSLVPLVVFKYTNLIASLILGPLFGTQHKLLDVPLPLGISFFTFTLIAYLVDLYRKTFPAVLSARELAAYTLFFPHSIAGPILRPGEFIPQLHKVRRALDARFTLGSLIFAFGLVKKLVFADQIATLVDPVYTGTGPLSALDYLMAIYGFSLQIYCDFSGYTDMAIGLAMMLRIRFPRNFLTPYRAVSVADFWRRWHITLSRWIRDYIYIPLGGNRQGPFRTNLNLFVTMGLAGLWHGANWTFVAWGLIHAAGIAWSHLDRYFPALAVMRRWPNALKVFVTFHFVTLAWILFRAGNLDTSWRVLTGPVTAPWAGAEEFFYRNLFALVLLVVFFATHKFDTHAHMRLLAKRLPRTVVWSVIVLAFVVSIAISTGSSSQFIYFEF